MSRRAFVLEELGLSPLWVRRVARNHGTEHRDESASILDVQSGTEATCAASAETAVDRLTQVTSMDWGQLKACASACKACVLHKTRKQAVFGVGDQNAEWLFVGEGPGADEDELGEPFVGQAGKLLDNMLVAIGLKRGRNVYIANVVKCRPPGNRTPLPEEAGACGSYLARQIELLRPRLIVALGKVAAQNLLVVEATLASLRGRVHQYRGTPLIVTYHPAYLLRNLADKAKSWEDLCFAVDTMKALKQSASAPN